MLASATGKSIFQPNSISLSALIRGNVLLIQIRKKTIVLNLMANHTAPGIKPKNGSGNQPPKKITVIKADMANI